MGFFQSRASRHPRMVGPVLLTFILFAPGISAQEGTSALRQRHSSDTLETLGILQRLAESQGMEGIAATLRRNLGRLNDLPAQERQLILQDSPSMLDFQSCIDEMAGPLLPGGGVVLEVGSEGSSASAICSDRRQGTELLHVALDCFLKAQRMREEALLKCLNPFEEDARDPRHCEMVTEPMFFTAREAYNKLFLFCEQQINASEIEQTLSQAQQNHMDLMNHDNKVLQSTGGIESKVENLDADLESHDRSIEASLGFSTQSLQRLDRSLQSHEEKRQEALDRHAQALGDHAQALGDHVVDLDSHNARLTRHANRLDSHSTAFDKHDETLSDHVEALEPHISQLSDHEDDQKEHRELLIAHDERLERFINGMSTSSQSHLRLSMGKPSPDWLRLRIEVERSLATGQRLFIYVLPRRSGGLLEEIRDLVDELVQKQDPDGSAGRYLEKGNEALAQGAFEDAFDFYSMAYRKASRLP